MDITSMDPRTAKLAIELQLSDIADSLDSLYEEALPEGDERASLQLIKFDLTRKLMLLEGQVLVIQILRDENNDRVAFKKLLDDEKQAVSDHQLALKLAGMPTAVPPVAQFHESEDCIDDDQWELAKELYAAAFEGEEPERPLPTKVSDRTPLHGVRVVTAEQARNNGDPLSRQLDTKCNVCMEVVPRKNTLRLQCRPESHVYCKPCLLDLFTSAISNSDMFPPRCCRQAIPLDTCRTMLPKELVKDFDLKVEELATANPTYCADASCSKFIRSKHIKQDIGSCVFCKRKTCVRCKTREHSGLCPSDPHVQLLMDAARRSRWQQCTKCHNMVELSQGCFHMTCRCRHQFCYLCGEEWKKCACPQWDEEYLTRPLPALPLLPAPAVVHEHSWERRNGGACQECDADWLPWVMRCRGCSLLNCWRCIHNRG